MEAADDEARTGRVREGEGEALVASGVLEGIEPHQTDPLDGPTPARLEDRGPGRQIVDLASDRIHLVEMGVENGTEVAIVRAAGQAVEPPAEAAKLPDMQEAQEQQAEDGDPKAGDDRAENRLDEGVQVDRSILRARSDGTDGGPRRAARV
jgi:hypothetical protein